MSLRSKQALKISVIDDPRHLEAMEQEWDALYHDCPSATPFQSWAWLYSWWEAYGEGHELRLITLRDEERLVGLIPLTLRRKFGIGVLRFLGHSQLSTYN